MLFAISTLLAAFALFFFEPLIGKALTPRFGGGAQVWAICLVFFQAMLLAGYFYADRLRRVASGRRQALIHGLLLLGAFAALLLGLPRLLSREALPGSPAFSLLLLLTSTAALPLFALSSTSPLLQAWAVRRGEKVPYRLYAWSNAGSFAGLLAFPFMLEPLLSTFVQGYVLVGLFALAALLILACAAGIMNGQTPSRDDAPIQGSSSWREKMPWLVGSFGGSALLVAITTKLTTVVAAVPLLWVLPLSVYLLTFVLLFDARLGLSRGLWPLVWMMLFGISAWVSVHTRQENGLTRWPHIASGLGMMLGGCMTLHGWVYEQRPEAERLTAFYLWIALGGVLGGLAVALVAPLAFDRIYEVGLCILLSGIAGAWASLGVAGIRRWASMGVAAVIAGIGIWAIRTERALPGLFLRNFYGIERFSLEGPYLRLDNMKTVHGIVDLRAPRSPMAYYGPDSGIGRTLDMEMKRKPALRVGVLGLGLGSVADYCRAEDTYTFYEINPLIINAVNSPSTSIPTLRGAPGVVKVVPGDGRLSMEQEHQAGTGSPYDVLLIDAFAGDAVPWHLLTREAFQTYLSRLAPDGLLVVHVTSPLAVDRMVLAQARDLGLFGAMEWDAGFQNGNIAYSPNFYVVLTRDNALLLDPGIQEHLVVGFGPKTFRGETIFSPILSFMAQDRAWTDARNSLSTLVYRDSAQAEIAWWIQRNPAAWEAIRGNGQLRLSAPSSSLDPKKE